jgi:hypothetical protein
VNGNIIKDFPLKEFENGHFSKVPVLTDRSQFEGIMFTNYTPKTKEDVMDDLSVIWPDQLRSMIEKLLQMYPSTRFNSTLFKDVTVVSAFKLFNGIDILRTLFGTGTLPDAVVQRQAIFGDVFVNCPTNYIANAVSTAGLATFKMVFNAGMRIHSSTLMYLWTETTDRRSS